MRNASRRRVVLIVVAILLLATLGMPLLNVNRFRADVALAIGRALGRRVTVGKVGLRILPQPGFALQNLVVADDPGFGAEPVLVASDVTAALRLSSLWRGRLEIAKLSLNDPSLNVTQRADGKWNLESLFERTTHTEAAPTPKLRPETRPRFPYIEAEGGRINLKLGQEKKAYALSNARFGLWLESEREWQVRLTASPVRTDDNLSDTGKVVLSGSFGSAEKLADTPLNLRLSWERAPLGQFTRLVYGRDRGWRGVLGSTVILTGTPANLSVRVQAGIEDFHRFDIYDAGNLRLQVTCSGRLSSSDWAMRDIQCNSGEKNPQLRLQGWARWSLTNPEYDLELHTENLPAASLVSLAGRMKQDLPQDLSAQGSLDASVRLHREANQPAVWEGKGTTSEVILSSSVLSAPLQLGTMQLQLMNSQSANLPNVNSQGKTKGKLPRANSVATPAEGPVLEIQPVAVALGGPALVTSQASFSSIGYLVSLQGDAESARLLQVAQALALPVPAMKVSGPARINLQVAGNWNGFRKPEISGSVRLREVSAQADGLATPFMIHSGNLSLGPVWASVENADFGFRGSDTHFTGWIRKPRYCQATASDAADPCRVEFQLSAKNLAVAELYEVLTPRRTQRAWYRLLSPSHPSEASLLSRVTATGKIAVRNLALDKISATSVRADVELNRGLLVLKQASADLLDGEYSGDLHADFRGSLPAYEWHGNLKDIAMEALADVIPAKWANGTASLGGFVRAKGSTTDALLESTFGSLALDWRHGMLADTGLNGADELFRWQRLTSELDLKNGSIKLVKANLVQREESFQLSGSVSLKGPLQVNLASSNRDARQESAARRRPRLAEYNLTGSMNDPVLKAVQPDVAPPVTIGVRGSRVRVEGVAPSVRIPLSDTR